MILFIGTYNKKIRIWKMGKNSSQWKKFDPLTTNIFLIYFSSLNIIWNLLLIINLNTNVMLEAKHIWNATEISILRQKFESFCKIWVVDAGYLWFDSFYFATVNSTFDTASLSFFVINLHIDSSTFFVLDESFDCSGSLT